LVGADRAAVVAHDILDVVSLLLMQVYYSHSSRIP
jgi:hypothetical protein